MLLQSCETPEEVADLTAYLADPERYEQDKATERLDLVRRFAEIG